MKKSIPDFLRTYFTSFVKQDILLATADLTTVQYADIHTEVGDNELGKLLSARKAKAKKLRKSFVSRLVSILETLQLVHLA